MDKPRPRPRLTRAQGRQLIEELSTGEKDLGLLARQYGVTVEDLARWAVRQDTRRVLWGLCVLHDFQTQLLVSRYRPVAAGRLLALANGAVGGTATEVKAADVIRRACVDVLRTDLKRIQPLAPGTPGNLGSSRASGNRGGWGDQELVAEEAARDELRRLLGDGTAEVEETGTADEELPTEGVATPHDGGEA